MTNNNVLYHPWFDDSKKQPLANRFRDGHAFISAKYGAPLFVLISRYDFNQLFPNNQSDVTTAELESFPGLKIEISASVQKDTFFFVYPDKKESSNG